MALRIRGVLLAGLVSVLVFSVVEGMAWGASGLLARRGLLVMPMDTNGYADYLARRDPVLGWPYPDSFGRGEYDASGSRRVPDHPDHDQPSCVAAYGDSFTWGDEVAAEDAYPSVLSRELGCRVANYGVPGYGTDQAFLRYRDRVEDPAPIVVLGHYVENVVRNVNQYRGFYTGRPDFGLKPRFVLEPSGRLVLIPLPELSEARFRALLERPYVLQHEFLRPGGPAGIAGRRFPHVLAVIRALGHYRLRARLRGEPSYAAFYDGDHPSNGLAVTAAILVAFHREALRRGQQPIVLLIPDEKDLALLREGRSVSYARLVRALQDAGIGPLDAAPGLLEAAGGGDPCALFTSCGGGHLNPRGYAELARQVHARIAAFPSPPTR